MFNSVITFTGMLIINAKCIILETAKALKTVPLPSIVNLNLPSIYLQSPSISHSPKSENFSISTMIFTKVSSLAIWLL